MSANVVRMVRRGALALAALTLTGAAGAEGIQAGQWKVTTVPTINGAPGAPQIKMRCLSAEEASDLDKTFSPEARTANSCERTEHEVTDKKLSWRLKCTGQPNMDVAATFDFDTPKHYSAVVTTNVSIGNQSMDSRATIEGEHAGECP